MGFETFKKHNSVLLSKCARKQQVQKGIYRVHLVYLEIYGKLTNLWQMMRENKKAFGNNKKYANICVL